MQPGDSINPQAPTTAQAQSPTPPQASGASTQPESQTPPYSPAAQADPPQESANWDYRPQPAADTMPRPQVDPVQWTASEYVSHDKSSGWLVLAILATIGISAILFLLTREWGSSVAVAIVGLAFAAFGVRKPHVLQYAVDQSGLHIQNRFYPYSAFRSFSILQEEAMRSILLMPLQRFALPITLYYAPDDEDKILAVLGAFLPHEDREPAAVDRMMSKIRF